MTMVRLNRNAWIWWVSGAALSCGTAIYVLLAPAEYDMDIQRYRAIALVSGFLIAGLCIIIGTSNRWFGKNR